MSKSADLDIQQKTQDEKNEDSAKDATARQQEDKKDLPPLLQKVHGAIWLIGLAFLFWRGDIFPGILVLVAISGIAQAVMQQYASRQKERHETTVEPERNLPNQCPNCGSPLNARQVDWLNATTAKCPYCGTAVGAIDA